VEDLMEDTLGGAMQRLRDVIGDQLAGYRRLLDTTRAGIDALRTHDLERFDGILEEQVDTLRHLKGLERERASVFRALGGVADPEVGGMRNELRALASEVQRAGRVERLVIERNGALVEARLGLHRQAGTLARGQTAGVHQVA
jgi:FlgN protein